YETQKVGRRADACRDNALDLGCIGAIHRHINRLVIHGECEVTILRPCHEKILVLCVVDVVIADKHFPADHVVLCLRVVSLSSGPSLNQPLRSYGLLCQYMSETASERHRTGVAQVFGANMTGVAEGVGMLQAAGEPPSEAGMALRGL